MHRVGFYPPFFCVQKVFFCVFHSYINFSKGGIFVIEIVHNTDNGIDEEKLYNIFVDIIKTIQLQEEDTDEKDDSVHEM